jgi:hypothetical protein
MTQLTEAMELFDLLLRLAQSGRLLKVSVTDFPFTLRVKR